jgi:L-lactate utilization protein LutC
MISHLDHLMDSTPEPYKPSKQVQLSEREAELKQEITELQAKCKELQEQINQEVYDLQVENYKLKNYIINQLLTN